MFWSIYSHDFPAKLWRHCECNPAVPGRVMLSVSI